VKGNPELKKEIALRKRKEGKIKGISRNVGMNLEGAKGLNFRGSLIRFLTKGIELKKEVALRKQD